MGCFIMHTCMYHEQVSRNSVVVKLGCYDFDCPGFEYRSGQFFFFPLKCSNRLWDSPNLVVGWFQGSFLGLKRPGSEVNLPLSSAQTASEWGLDLGLEDGRYGPLDAVLNAVMNLRFL